MLVLARGALIDWIAGYSVHRAVHAPEEGLSAEAQALVERCLAGLDPALLIDHHAHLAGTGEGSDCWVNPRLRSPRHLRDWLRFQTYRSAAGMEGGDPDIVFVDNLAGLLRAEPRPPRALLLAFDYRYGLDGARIEERSEFYVPNDYVLGIRDAHPDLFLAAASIHPYRSDAIEELERVHAAGVRVLKWLPSAQGIDMASPRCGPFFEACARLEVALLVHAGAELAVDAAEDQGLGNPLLLRHPLRAGVRVIAAHCASLGEDEDLDDPGRPLTSSFDLFVRLLEEPEWEGLLYGEISTVTQRNRFPLVLAELLRRQDLHARLINGSDWPLPGVNLLYSTRALQRGGFLSEDERTLLNEVYQWNPLLFDLCLKRTVRAPESGERFLDEVFHAKFAVEGI
ncbi:MAG: amidohydrolase family protein [Planctomycetota bacterium]|nr:amidohydrolase family protein [Planctomycetota bacterium]